MLSSVIHYPCGILKWILVLPRVHGGVRRSQAARWHLEHGCWEHGGLLTALQEELSHQRDASDSKELP